MSAASLSIPGSPLIKDLFEPCNRWRDLYISQVQGNVGAAGLDILHDRIGLEEVELTPRGQALLGSSIGVVDPNVASLHSFLHGKVAWLGEGICVDGTSDDPFRMMDDYAASKLRILAVFESGRHRRSQSLDVTYLRRISETHVVRLHDLLFQYLTSCNASALELVSSKQWNPRPLFSASALTQFLTHQHAFPKLSLVDFYLDDSICHALLTARPDLELELRNCLLTGEGERILVEGIRNNRGPSCLSGCHAVNVGRLMHALRGNCSVKRLELNAFGTNSQVLLTFLQALSEFTGLTSMKLMGFRVMMVLDENHCRSLVTDNISELQIELDACGVTDAGKEVILDGIRRNRGPSCLSNCEFDTRSLADSLIETSVTFLELLKDDINSKEDLRYLLQALEANIGLTTFTVNGTVDDENWSLMCQSLSNHPALDHLNVRLTSDHDASSLLAANGGTMKMAEARRTRRTQGLVEMLKVNTILTRIDTTDEGCDERILQNKVHPRLELNKFRPRIVAVKKAKGTQRVPLFGRALHAVNGNNTFLYVMIKGNVDLFTGLSRVRMRQARKRTRYTK